MPAPITRAVGLFFTIFSIWTIDVVGYLVLWLIVNW
jgi:phage shock protein PspC (stress-responsive transcriptional regulator)